MPNARLVGRVFGPCFDVVNVSSAAANAGICRFIGAGFSDLFSRVNFVFTGLVRVPKPDKTRGYRIADLSGFLVVFAPYRSLDISFCCGPK